jgi:hypothetical protein
MAIPEPASQQKTLDKRERQLRRAIAQMEPAEKLRKSAEYVRSAQLLKVRAQYELCRYTEDANSKRIKGIRRKRAHWQGISVEAILMLYAI